MQAKQAIIFFNYYKAKNIIRCNRAISFFAKGKCTQNCNGPLWRFLAVYLEMLIFAVHFQKFDSNEKVALSSSSACSSHWL